MCGCVFVQRVVWPVRSRKHCRKNMCAWSIIMSCCRSWFLASFIGVAWHCTPSIQGKPTQRWPLTVCLPEQKVVVIYVTTIGLSLKVGYLCGRSTQSAACQVGCPSTMGKVAEIIADPLYLNIRKLCEWPSEVISWSRNHAFLSVCWSALSCPFSYISVNNARFL